MLLQLKFNHNYPGIWVNYKKGAIHLRHRMPTRKAIAGFDSHDLSEKILGLSRYSFCLYNSLLPSKSSTREINGFILDFCYLERNACVKPLTWGRCPDIKTWAPLKWTLIFQDAKISLVLYGVSASTLRGIMRPRAPYDLHLGRKSEFTCIVWSRRSADFR